MYCEKAPIIFEDKENEKLSTSGGGGGRLWA